MNQKITGSGCDKQSIWEYLDRGQIRVSTLVWNIDWHFVAAFSAVGISLLPNAPFLCMGQVYDV